MSSSQADVSSSGGVTQPYAQVLVADPGRYARRMLLCVAPQSSVLANVPVLVVLNPLRFNVALVAPDLADIRFTTVDGASLLSHEVESRGVLGVQVWVRLPLLTPDGPPTCFWMYGGNASVSGQDGGPGVWSNGFESVHHFSEVAGVHRDGTGHGHDSVETSVAGQGVAGLVGGADDFVAVNDDHVRLAPVSGRSFNQQLTVELLFKRHQYGNAWVVQRWLGGQDMFEVHLRGPESGNSMGWRTSNSGSGALEDRMSGLLPVDVDTWCYAVAVFDGPAQQMRLYVNGVLDTQAATTQSTFFPWTADVTVGYLPGSSVSYDGLVDELRISSVARTAAEVAFQNATLRDAVLTYGPVEPTPP